jgi:archaemetzincin
MLPDWSAFGFILLAGTIMSTGACEGSDAAPSINPRASGKAEDRIQQLAAMIEHLRPLCEKLEKPRPGDWLAVHHEPGQTFKEYLASNPVSPLGNRRAIYLQPIGEFTPTQRRVLALTGDFMDRYFGLPVRVKDNLPLSLIPDKARRVHPSWGDRQILTTYVLDEVLIPRRPEDAAAYLALTAVDLWPGHGWNFVFGQASLNQRVGVWSIYRNGNPDNGEAGFRLCLLRTLKTATHETGHMFGIWHCTAYRCAMCGSNSREEGDRRPLECCPECMGKICWATGTDPVGRYRRLADFCKEQGLAKEAAFYEKSLTALSRREG